MVEQKYSRVEATRNLGQNPQVLGRWHKEAEGDDGYAFRGNGTLTPQQAEIHSLKRQVKRLEMEREILKKRRTYLSKKRREIFVSYPF